MMMVIGTPIHLFLVIWPIFFLALNKGGGLEKSEWESDLEPKITFCSASGRSMQRPNKLRVVLVFMEGVQNTRIILLHLCT